MKIGGTSRLSDDVENKVMRVKTGKKRANWEKETTPKKSDLLVCSVSLRQYLKIELTVHDLV